MKQILIILCFVFFLPACSQAQENGEDKYLDVQTLKTPGGITIWLVEDHSLPLISMKFRFLDSGSALDPEDKQGLAQLLSNTMDEGAGELSSQAFQKQLSDNSITLRFSSGRDGFGGNLKTLTRHKQKAFDLLKLAMTEPRFDPEPVERMRQANLARIRSSISNPQWMNARLMNDQAFEGHSYARNSGGTLSSLEKITPEDLRNFQQNYLSKDRLIISIAGDITPDQAITAAENIFAALPDKAPEKSVSDYSVQNMGEIVLYKQDIPQTIITAVMPAFDRDNEDYYALRVMNYILGESGFGSRLMEEAREKRGLTYGIYSSVRNYRHLDALMISTSTRNETVPEMLSVIKEEMDKLKTTPVSDQELEDAKSYLIGSLPLALTSTEDISGIMLSLQAEALPPDYLELYADKIRTVTPEDIQRVAKKVLKPEDMLIVMTGSPEGVKASKEVQELPNVY